MLASLSRVTSPAWIDTLSYSCATVWRQRVQNICSSCVVLKDESPNKDFKVNELFVNRNPRNLETMGHARKRKGWFLNYPKKNYYNKLFFERSMRHITGWVEHSSGKTVTSASTREWAIRDHLYSCTDMSAAMNVGRVLSQRCIESGMTHIYYNDYEHSKPSQAMKVFMAAMKKGGVVLRERGQHIPKYEPGLNYDDKQNRYNEKKTMKDDYQPV